ncbi:MAG: hypothetical protein ACKVPY_02945 [Paracoccaceae bacterium]
MKRLIALAALATLPTALQADDSLARRIGAIPVAWKSLAPGSATLSLAITGEIGRAPHHWPASGRVQGGLRRLVVVDGTLMELDERFLKDRIGEGTLTVVYPGTNIPLGQTAAPAYPPAWLATAPNG